NRNSRAEPSEASVPVRRILSFGLLVCEPLDGLTKIHIQFAMPKPSDEAKTHRVVSFHARNLLSASCIHVVPEELDPHKFFDPASLYTARVVNPEQARSVINTAILTAVLEKGPTVIGLPGDVASTDVEVGSTQIMLPATPLLSPADADLNRPVEMIDDAETVAIFGGDGCRYAHDEVVELAKRLKAPVGY